MRRALVLSAFVLLSLAAWAARPETSAASTSTSNAASVTQVERVMAEPNAHQYELVAELRGEAASTELDAVLQSEALKVEANVVKLDRMTPVNGGKSVQFEARAFRKTSTRILSAQR